MKLQTKVLRSIEIVFGATEEMKEENIPTSFTWIT